jgi:hypothetical protein
VLVAANGRLRSFSKTTHAPDGGINISTEAFFGLVRAGFTPFSPHVRFDRFAGRWFVVMATDAVPGRIVIASSDNWSINPGTVWSFFAFDNTFPATGCAVDVPTLGIDNAARHRRAAILHGWDNLCGHIRLSFASVGRRPRPGIRDRVPQPHWHAGGRRSLRPRGVETMTRLRLGHHRCRQRVIRHVDAAPRVDAGRHADYFGNLAVAVPATSVPIAVRHAGNTGASTAIWMAAMTGRSASIKNGRLWTTHAIGVTETGQASGSATRNGVRW